MKTSDIHDDRFRQAVDAVDAGDIAELRELIAHDPGLVQKPLHTPNEEGYFKNPYLLWFIADNPIRNFTLATNIVEITELLAEKVKQLDPETAQHQLDYALELVVTGSIPRERGMQIALMDILMDSGAASGNPLAALANNNFEAAKHLLNRGAKLTLPVAVGLGKLQDAERLFVSASAKEKATTLTVAAFFGIADMVSWLLQKGVDPNGEMDKIGFHTHGTPLHQAVSSGSLATVKLLVEAGADLNATDKIYSGTPVAWADYMQRNGETTDEMREHYKAIEAYLKSL